MPGWRERLFGNKEEYDYGSLCVPNLPCFNRKKQLRFYTKDEKIPLMLALLMGLQHAFSMVGGLITPPFVVFRFAVGAPFENLEEQQYAISAALITSGICTCINVSKIPLPFSKRIFKRQLFLGAGILSVMGTSFTFLPIYEISIRQMRDDGIDGFTAYGKMLGTSMLCALVEVILSVMPTKFIHRLFPPIVTSITVMLIGVSLVGTGMKYWGGGVVCAEMIWKQHDQAVAAEGIFPLPSPICTGNGDVTLGYGSAEYIGLGFSVMVGLVVIELWGSTFMKNCNVLLALLFGYLISAVSRYNGENYVDSSKIANADWITFLWTTTFPLGLYGPAVIPLLIAFLVTTVETVGDISAVYEVSDLDTKSRDFDESIQGGLTADSMCSILAGLCTSMPNTTFSQNNGVIALTKCASRRSGYACGFWLILMGVFAKIAGIITSIPDAVLGGMVIFLFANVLTSGVALASTLDLHSRRVKFIMALSLAVGIGVTVWPFAFQDMRASTYTANFWRCEDCSETLQGVRNGVSIFLSTGYCVGTVFAMLLNFILGEDDVVIKPNKDGEVEPVDQTIVPKVLDDDSDDQVPSSSQEESMVQPVDGEEPIRDDEVAENEDGSFDEEVMGAEPMEEEGVEEEEPTHAPKIAPAHSRRHIQIGRLRI